MGSHVPRTPIPHQPSLHSRSNLSSHTRNPLPRADPPHSHSPRSLSGKLPGTLSRKLYGTLHGKLFGNTRKLSRKLSQKSARKTGRIFLLRDFSSFIVKQNPCKNPCSFPCRFSVQFSVQSSVQFSVQFSVFLLCSFHALF